jgi:hypothetical protein
MRAFVTIYSKLFLDSDDDTWSARPNNALLQRLHNGEGSARWVACISDSYISIGDPVQGEGNRKVLYLPQWFMESLGVEDGYEVDLDFKRSEEMPRATSLTFRMMGPAADVDIRDLLEEPLSQLGVLQVGQIIPVPAFEGVLLLESCEPDGVVFLDGAEIALDIIPDSADSPASASAPAPSPASAFAEESDEEPMIPVPSKPFVAPPVAPTQTRKFPPKYIPFQGTGYKLG